MIEFEKLESDILIYHWIDDVICVAKSKFSKLPNR